MKPSKSTAPRIFIGPIEIAGIANGLAKGFHELEIDAQVFLSVAHSYGYDKTLVSWSLRIWQRIGAARRDTTREQLLRKLILIALHDLWAWFILAKVLIGFDVFIFLFGQTVTNTRFELWLLKFLEKRIIFIYVGSDSRPPYIDGGRFPGEGVEGLPDSELLYAMVKSCKRKIRLHEAYADYLVNAPATAQFHERPYINWFTMGVPRVLPSDLQSSLEKSKTIRILHSPSNPLVKGSVIIISIVKKLRAKGYPIELITIQGVSNDVVFRELARCDFVIDQLYSDTPFAVFATEAAFFGKPAIVGGYFAGKELDYLAVNDIPPSLFVNPEEIEAAIECLILNTVFREELGAKARKFVESQWSGRSVAERYLQLLTDDVPSQWWCDPQVIRYVEGCGLSRQRSGRLIANLLERFGPHALQVSDKPELEAAFIALSNRQSECVDA